MMHPAADLLNTALNWGGINTGEINKKKFSTLIESYYQKINFRYNFFVAWQSFFPIILSWLSFNLDCYFDNEKLQNYERKRAEIAIQQTITALVGILKNFKLLEELFNKYS